MAALETQRRGGRKSTGKTRTGGLRGTNQKIGHTGKDAYQRLDAIGMIAVVVGYKNKRFLKILHIHLDFDAKLLKKGVNGAFLA